MYNANSFIVPNGYIMRMHLSMVPTGHHHYHYFFDKVHARSGCESLTLRLVFHDVATCTFSNSCGTLLCTTLYKCQSIFCTMFVCVVNYRSPSPCRDILLCFDNTHLCTRNIGHRKLFLSSLEFVFVYQASELQSIRR